jgi:hypothetical protein
MLPDCIERTTCFALLAQPQGNFVYAVHSCTAALTVAHASSQSSALQSLDSHWSDILISKQTYTKASRTSTVTTISPRLSPFVMKYGGGIASLAMKEDNWYSCTMGRHGSDLVGVKQRMRNKELSRWCGSWTVHDRIVTTFTRPWEQVDEWLWLESLPSQDHGILDRLSKLRPSYQATGKKIEDKLR